MTRKSRKLVGQIGLVALLGCAMALAQDVLKPRHSALEYPASRYQPTYSVGAKRLSKSEIKQLFATDLASRYLVVEVAMYPSRNGILHLQRSDFALHVKGTQDIVRPASADEIASILQRRPSGGRDITLYPSVGVGYGTGPFGSGTSVGTGVGVGVGSSTSGKPTTEGDRRAMEAELSDKSLQEGEIRQPVAGYLYFPLPKEKGDYELEYRNSQSISYLLLNTP